MTTEREKLAEIIFRMMPDEVENPATESDSIADAILAAGFTRPVAATGVTECVWTMGDSGFGDDIWYTACDQAHQFTCDGPAENSYRHCPYCGRHLKAAAGQETGNE